MSFQLPETLIDEVHDLTLVCLDGEASPEEIQRLNAVLSNNQEARRIYARAIRDAYRLRRWAMSDVESADDMFNSGDSDAEFLRMASGESDAAEFATPVPLSLPIPLDLSSAAQPSPGLFAFGGSTFSYAAAAVLTSLMLLVLWTMSFSHNKDFAKAPPAGPSVQNDLRPEWVGRITCLADCRWADPDTQAIAGSLVSLGRKYALASGLLEITYDSGARVILEGPCTYQVESSAGGYLARGKLTARIISAKPQAANPEPRTPNPEPRNSSLIPHPSSLFSVRTPTALVTDLGTEFGVEVDANGDTVSYVFQGSIKVQGLGASVAGGAVLKENESIRVSMVREVHQGNKQELASFTRPATPPRFVRNMPSAGTRNGESYAELVMSFHPVAYYRMERPDDQHGDRIVTDHAGGGFHGERASGSATGNPYRPGRFGDALWLRGRLVGDSVLAPDYPKAENGKLTVTAWVTADYSECRWPRIVSNWGLDTFGQFTLGLFDRDGDLVVRVSQGDGMRITLREGRKFPTDEWQHVAFVVDGETLRLYRNGEEVGRTKCDGLLSPSPIKPLSIGFKTRDDGVTPHTVTNYRWCGLIDELAIFNAALSADDIRRLREGKSSTPTNSSRKGGVQ